MTSACKQLWLPAIFWILTATAPGATARNRAISFNRSGDNVTESLRSQLKGLTRGDTATITFGNGNFFIDGSVQFMCSAVIRGQGADKSKVMLSNTGRFSGDYYIGFNGKKGHELGVEITAMSFDMVPHDDTWWNADSQKFLFKFIHTDGVNIHQVSSNLSNAACTTMDFRVCRNVNISDCNLINYNNSDAGGIIWLRRDNINVSITGNKIYKYGDDEAIAIWEAGDDNTNLQPTIGVKRNITIANNDIRFIPCNNAKKQDSWSVQFTMYSFSNETKKKIHAAIHWSDIRVENNDFYIDAPIKSLLSINYDENDTHERVNVSGNRFTFTSRAGFEGRSHSDFEVHDASSGDKEAVVFSDNSITTDCLYRDKWGDNGHYHLIIDGARVLYTGNSLTSRSQTIDRKLFGPLLVWAQNRGCDLTLTDNEFDGISKIGQFAGGDGVDHARLTATGNTFTGDTRIFCRGLRRADLTFTSNVFNSSHYEVLLQEFANEGTLVFTGNTVNSTSRHGGSLITHYDKNTDLHSMRFERLEVGGNRLSGISNRQWLPEGLNIGKRKLYRDYYE